MSLYPELNDCSHRPPCPGCPGLGHAGLDPDGVATLRALTASLGAPEPTHVWLGGRGYRHRARLSFRGTRGSGRFGLFEEGSHRLVAIPECPIHHPALVRAAARTEELLAKHGIEPYEEFDHRGVLRAAQFVVERLSEKVQITLVCRDKLGPGSYARAQLTPALRELSQESFVHSIVLNAQPARNNLLLGDRFEMFHGPECTSDHVGGASIFYPPGAFGQANPAAHDVAVRLIHESVSPGAIVSEFYAGTGSIGLGLCHKAALRMNEIGKFSLEGLRRGIAALPTEVRKPSIHEGAAEACLSILEGADVVVVDPPRKGLSPQVVSELCRTKVASLWYLSCGLSSFVRDAELLSGAYALRSVTMLPYFPYTEHIETLALFEART